MMRVVAVLCCCLALAEGRPLSEDLSLFTQFRNTYNKQYKPDEVSQRMQCFSNNLNEIYRLNRQGDKAVYGVNQFSDMCREEFKTYHNLKISLNHTANVPKYTTEQIRAAPRGVDWRNKGAVTNVKDQGRCGSCWAFSATGNMEGQHAIASGNLVSLSEEELVQCDSDSEGCSGGYMEKAFDWVINNGGIATEQNYPYTSGGGETGYCSGTPTGGASFSGKAEISQDEDQIASYLANHGPISTGVDANTWQHYSGGIMSNCNGQKLDHGVLIVGYGNDGGQGFWIVKNSWAASWGENGYIRLAKGSNQCGLALTPCSITV